MTAPDAIHGSLLQYGRALFTLLEANRVTLGLEEVYFGDQVKIPKTPTLVVEPDTKRRELAGVPRRVENTLRAWVIIYYSRVENTETSAVGALEVAERVETFLHRREHQDLNGLVIHMYCTETEPGYRTKDNSRFRAVRLSVEGITKTMLGM